MKTLSNFELCLDSYFSFSHSHSDLCMIYNVSTGKASQASKLSLVRFRTLPFRGIFLLVLW